MKDNILQFGATPAPQLAPENVLQSGTPHVTVDDVASASPVGGNPYEAMVAAFRRLAFLDGYARCAADLSEHLRLHGGVTHDDILQMVGKKLQEGA